MERNINKQNNKMNMDNSYMKKFFIISAILWLMVLSFNSVFGFQEDNIIYYPVESATGTIVFDTSGNGYNSILVNGALFTSANANKFGTYNIQFDGINDYATSTGVFPITTNYSVSFWIRSLTGTNKDVYYQILGTNEYNEIFYDWATNTLNLEYRNSNGLLVTKVLDNFIPANNVWYHIVVSFDVTNNRYSYYRDNNLILSNQILTGGYKFNETETKSLSLANENPLMPLNYYGGRLDSFRIFNFVLNQTQVNSLFLTDTIAFSSYAENNTIPVTETQYIKLINSTSITDGQEFNLKKVDLIVNLNQKADCEIYFDNSLFDSSKDLLNFKSTKEFSDYGNHIYMVYCEKIVGDTKYIDYTPTINFGIVQGNRAIEFNFVDVNSENLLGEDFYLSTPCFESQIENPYYIPENAYYIKNLKDGFVTFNLSYISEYEFCLYRGNINLNSETDGFTKQFNIVELKKEIPLGTIIIGTNTTSYQLNIDDYDKYSPTEPEFWGKDWKGLGTFFASLILGFIFVGIGIWSKSDKVVVMGALIILAGLGISIGGLFLGALF